MERSIYAKAIDVIHERGWGKGTRWGRPKESVCLEEAIETAAGRTAEIREAVSALVQAVGRRSFLWNDAPERTKEDVILLLEYADAGELETWSKLYGSDAEA